MPRRMHSPIKLGILIILSLFSIFQSVNSIAISNSEIIPDFNGFRVYRLNATTKEQFDALVTLQDTTDMDFWQAPRLNAFTDIMVTQGESDTLQKLIETLKIEYTIMINNVAKILSEQQQDDKKSKEPIQMNWKEYHNIETIFTWLEQLENDYSDLMSVETIGHSTEGNALKLAKISLGETDKPAVFIDGTFHAREWISPAVVTFMINELVTKSKKYVQLLEKFDFYVLPIVNPDGYIHTMKYNRLWRKTRVPGTRDSLGGLIGCRGVDLNRNFGYEWAGVGSSSNPCSLQYRGPAPFSEPESAAIRDFVLDSEKKWRAYFSMHSYGQKWLTPWAHTAELPEDYDELKRVGDIGAAAIYNVSGTHYQVGTNNDLLYLASGGSDDWFKGVAECKYSYILELPDTGLFGFLLPYWKIVSTAEETWAGIQAALFEIPAEDD